MKSDLDKIGIFEDLQSDFFFYEEEITGLKRFWKFEISLLIKHLKCDRDVGTLSRETDLCLM